MPTIARRAPGQEQGTSMLELFYDLVFVFAVTQISHFLLDGNLTWEGAGQATLILLVVWWSWNFTTWFTNEIDPDSTAVRALMIALMLATMLMAVAIPDAFGDRALLFAGAYVAIQVGRQSFLTFAAAEAGTVERRRALHVLIWFLAAGALWIAGAFAGDGGRTVLWLLALAIDYTGPAVTFRVPWMRPIEAGDWSVGADHLAERFQLFVIIALGESIVITGTTTSGLDLNAPTIAAFVLAFVGTAALWWLYFNVIAGRLRETLVRTDRRTLAARDAYTYLHAALIAGIVVTAVGDELVIAHPAEHLQAPEAIAVVAGPVIYLLAQATIRLRLTHTMSPRRVGGAAGCVIVGLALSSADALVLGTGVTAVLIAIVVADIVAGRRRTPPGAPA